MVNYYMLNKVLDKIKEASVKGIVKGILKFNDTKIFDGQK